MPILRIHALAGHSFNYTPSHAMDFAVNGQVVPADPETPLILHPGDRILVPDSCHVFDGLVSTGQAEIEPEPQPEPELLPE